MSPGGGGGGGVVAGAPTDDVAVGVALLVVVPPLMSLVVAGLAVSGRLAAGPGWRWGDRLLLLLGHVAGTSPLMGFSFRGGPFWWRPRRRPAGGHGRASAWVLGWMALAASGPFLAVGELDPVAAAVGVEPGDVEGPAHSSRRCGPAVWPSGVGGVPQGTGDGLRASEALVAVDVLVARSWIPPGPATGTGPAALVGEAEELTDSEQVEAGSKGRSRRIQPKVLKMLRWSTPALGHR